MYNGYKMCSVSGAVSTVERQKKKQPFLVEDGFVELG